MVSSIFNPIIGYSFSRLGASPPSLASTENLRVSADTEKNMESNAQTSIEQNILLLRDDKHGLPKMLYILNHYGKNVEDISDNSKVLENLTSLAKEINEDEQESIAYWLDNGGSLPFPQPKRYPLASGVPRNKRTPRVKVEQLEGIEIVDLEEWDRGRNKKIKCEAEHDDNELTFVSTDMECAVCMESLPSFEFPYSKISEDCAHEHTVCRSCITEAVGVAIKDGDLDQVVCPLCPGKLTYEAVQGYTSEEQFARYDDLLFKSAVRDNLTMCLGPGCGAGQIHDGGDNRSMMICYSCRFATCARHQIPWHSGQSCDEYDRAYEAAQSERRRAEEATIKLLAETSKICPQCRQGVTKHGGCDHLMCRCGGQWCYICLAPWAEIIRTGNHLHAVTCFYHPSSRAGNDEGVAAVNLARMMELVRGAGEPATPPSPEVGRAVGPAREPDPRPVAQEAPREELSSPEADARPSPTHLAPVSGASRSQFITNGVGEVRVEERNL